MSQDIIIVTTTKRQDELRKQRKKYHRLLKHWGKPRNWTLKIWLNSLFSTKQQFLMTYYAVCNEVRVSRTKTLNSKSAVDLSPVKGNWLVDNTNFMFYSPTYAAQNFLENSHFIVWFPRDWLCKKIYIHSLQKASNRKTSIGKEVSTKTSCCHLSEYHSHAKFSVFNSDGWMMLFQYWCDWLDYWEEGRLAVFSETFPRVSAEFPPLLIPRLDLGVFLIIGRARLHFFCLQGQMKSNNNIYHMI